MFVDDGRILLGRRSPDRRLRPNCWDMIGGEHTDIRWFTVAEALDLALAEYGDVLKCI